VTTDPDRAVARLAAGQWSVLSVDELLACGLSHKCIEVRVRRGQLHPRHRDVYAVGHPNIPLEGRFLAAVKACGHDALLSRYAAACLRGYLVFDGRPIDVTAPTKRSHPGINTHRGTRERTIVKGIPVTNPVDTLIDLARQVDLPLLTRAVRNAKLSEQELAALPRQGKFKQILSTAPTVSRLEDIVLDLILSGGLEHPEVNQPYILPGRVVYPDFRWPAQRLIVEADSREWHSDPLAQRADAERQALLEAAGERVIRVTYEQATKQPQRTLARLRAALRGGLFGGGP
jgi:hypothetical protein